MATQGNNLSEYNEDELRPIPGVRIGIVVAEWNRNITSGLLEGALEVLKPMMGMKDILIHHVPGSFELPLGAQWLFEEEAVDAVICIGSVIRGETAHFDYVCQAASQGIMKVGLRQSRPCMFCVLTDDNMEQSIARSGGELGNKGTEAAVAAWKLLQLKQKLRSEG